MGNENGFPWDSAAGDERFLTAQELANAFGCFITNGVMDINTDFLVGVEYGSSVRIGPGIAWINGRMWRLSGVKQLSLPFDSSSVNQKGIIVLKVDLDNRTFAFEAKGVPLTYDYDVNEIPIAEYPYDSADCSISQEDIISITETACARQLYVDELTDQTQNTFIKLVRDVDDDTNKDFALSFRGKRSGEIVEYAKARMRDLDGQLIFNLIADNHNLEYYNSLRMFLKKNDIERTTFWSDELGTDIGWEGEDNVKDGVTTVSGSHVSAFQFSDNLARLLLNGQYPYSASAYSTTVGWHAEDNALGAMDHLSELWFLDGSIKAVIDGTWMDLGAWLSDASLKKNIVDSEVNGIDFVKQLKHRSFSWVPTWKSVSGDEPVGYVAQELQSIDPATVKEIKSPDGNVILQVREDVIIPYLSKALQEIIEHVERLEKELAELKGANQSE